MKKLLVVVVLIVVGFVAYKVATTGEVPFVSSFSVSAEERQVKQLQTDFEAARKQFSQAHRTSAVSGVDTTADAEAARRAVSRIGKELKSLRKRLSDAKAMRRADELADLVTEFSKQLG